MENLKILVALMGLFFVFSCSNENKVKVEEQISSEPATEVKYSNGRKGKVSAFRIDTSQNKRILQII